MCLPTHPGPILAAIGIAFIRQLPFLSRSAVISGAADIGMVRTDMWESMEKNGEIDLGLIKVLAPKDLGSDSMFPFQTSTLLYPEWPVAALRHVPNEVSKAVAAALFQINISHPAAVAGKYSSWIPPLSYASLNSMQRSLGWINEHVRPSAQTGFVALGQCMKSVHFYDAVVCPTNFVKISEEEMHESCSGVNTTACPKGYTCVCKPCRRVPDVEFTVAMGSEYETQKSPSTSTLQFLNRSGKLRVCEVKLGVCASGASGHQVTVVIRDNWVDLRGLLDIEPVVAVRVKFHHDNGGADPWIVADAAIDRATKAPTGNYIATFSSFKAGSHLVEVVVNERQVPSSPIFVETEAPPGKYDNSAFHIGVSLSSAIVLILIAMVAKLRMDFVEARKPVDFQCTFDRMKKNGDFAPDSGGMVKIPREIRRRDLELIERIGQGAFGDVWKAILDETHTRGNPSFTVAVKTVSDPKVHITGSDDLLSEAALMAQVTDHPNLVSIIGVITSGDPYALVLQYCNEGSVLAHLKQKFAGGDAVSQPVKMIMGVEVASGMEHLGKLKLIHRDLAARNVLLATGNSTIREALRASSHTDTERRVSDSGASSICKVADFGLSRRASNSAADDAESYYKSSMGVFPLRWTAPEAMETLRFSAASDIWSYGVFIVELLLDGETPYPRVSNPDVMNLVMRGDRHSQPRACSDELYAILLQCWDANPSLRPSFSTLAGLLTFTIDDQTSNGGQSPFFSSVSADAETPLTRDDNTKEENARTIAGYYSLEATKRSSRALYQISTEVSLQSPSTSSCVND
jgi:serine/threonine protein kinase